MLMCVWACVRWAEMVLADANISYKHLLAPQRKERICNMVVSNLCNSLKFEIVQ